MEKYEKPDFVKTQMHQLSDQILEWMGHTYGANLIPSQILNEIKVKNIVKFKQS